MRRCKNIWSAHLCTLLLSGVSIDLLVEVEAILLNMSAEAKHHTIALNTYAKI